MELTNKSTWVLNIHRNKYLLGIRPGYSIHVPDLITIKLDNIAYDYMEYKLDSWTNFGAKLQNG